MRATRYSVVLFCCALVGAGTAAIAQESSTPPAAPPADAPPAGPSPEMLKKARANGVKPEVRKGVTVYCWEDADIGSRFKTKKCVGEDQLDALIARRQAQRDELSRGGGYTGGSGK